MHRSSAADLGRKDLGSSDLQRPLLGDNDGTRGLRRALWSIGLVAATAYMLFESRAPLWFSAAVKPLPVLCLAIWTWREYRESYGRRIIAGLLLAMCGDIALVWPGNDAFLVGLVFNLLAHVAYAVAFTGAVRRWHVLRALPVVLWLGILYAVIFPGLGVMKVPAAVYSLAIGVMVWRAAACVGEGQAPRRSEWAGFLGAFLFLVCDTLIALHRFHQAIPLRDLLVILAYWLGQCGLALSAAGRQAAFTTLPQPQPARLNHQGHTLGMR